MRFRNNIIVAQRRKRSFNAGKDMLSEFELRNSVAAAEDQFGVGVENIPVQGAGDTQRVDKLVKSRLKAVTGGI